MAIMAKLSDGLEHEFGEMEMADWCAFATWLNQQEGQPPGKPRGIQALYEAVDTFQGGRWILQRSLSKNGPVMPAQLDELIPTPLALNDLGSVLLQICGLPHEDGKKGNPPGGDEPNP